MPTDVRPWGAVDGVPVALVTLRTGRGLVARISTLGAALVGLAVPDRDGRLADVVLGFDTLAEYEADGSYFGVVVGRVANRIAGASFELDGRPYALAANAGSHHLHGGPGGLHDVVFDAATHSTGAGPAVTLQHTSPDGAAGYPGRLQVEVTYTLADGADGGAELIIDMQARSDRPTPVSLAHHAYWNLAGHDGGDVLAHELRLHASRYTPTDAELIPTGELAAVAGTPFDFTTPKPLGRDLARLPPGAGGYDCNVVVDGEPLALRPVAEVHEPVSGRVLRLSASAPGVQLYTGNHLDGLRGKGGAIYGRHHAFCLETQHFPDAVHHEGQPGWPSVVLAPGALYRHRMVAAFSTR